MKKHICKFCSKELASSSSLNNHITKAQYCIRQRKDLSNIVVFNCNSCNKKYTSKQSLEIHSVKCTNKKINTVVDNYKSIIDDQKLIINEQKQTIRELQDKLHDIAIKAVQRPTTTTNNMNKTQINNFIEKMEPISQKFLVDKAPNLTIEHIQKGASGYAEYALEYPLKDRVACVDYSRRKIKFKDTDGNVVTDPEMMKLAPMFFDSIKDKSSELVHSLNTPDMDSAVFEEVAKLFNTNSDVKIGSTGVKTEFYHDFVKHVCSGSVVE